LLVAALDGEGVAGAYGRQLPHEDATPPEQVFLVFMYGPAARVQRLGGTQELSFEQTLFSNVNSAMPRKVWEADPFRDDVAMSEDQDGSGRRLIPGPHML